MEFILQKKKKKLTMTKIASNVDFSENIFIELAFTFLFIYLFFLRIFVFISPG